MIYFGEILISTILEEHNGWSLEAATIKITLLTQPFSTKILSADHLFSVQSSKKLSNQVLKTQLESFEIINCGSLIHQQRNCSTERPAIA